MITDSATTFTIITVIVISVLVLFIMIYSHFTRKKDLKMLARCSVMMSNDSEVSGLCKQIMELNLNAYPMLDKDMHEIALKEPERLKLVLKQQLKKLQDEIASS